MLKSFISSMAEIASTSAIITYLESDNYHIMADLIGTVSSPNKRLSINVDGVATYINDQGQTIVEMAKLGKVFIRHNIDEGMATITTTEGGFRTGVYSGDHLPKILSTLAILFK